MLGAPGALLLLLDEEAAAVLDVETDDIAADYP
jgi:hypothetical protein